MRNIEQHTDDHAPTELESPRADLQRYDQATLGVALEREGPQGRNWATLLILLSIVFVQALVIGLVIWTLFW